MHLVLGIQILSRAGREGTDTKGQLVHIFFKPTASHMAPLHDTLEESVICDGEAFFWQETKKQLILHVG